MHTLATHFHGISIKQIIDQMSSISLDQTKINSYLYDFMELDTFIESNNVRTQNIFFITNGILTGIFS
jgi:hypothetical protein